MAGYFVFRWNKKRQRRIDEEQKRLEIEKLLSDLSVIEKMDGKGTCPRL